jgi:Zn-dependent protease
MDFEFILKTIPAAIIGLTIHEYSHALMSTKLGDSTAKDEGRLTLNPIKHIDPIGFLLIIVAGFGWAKPVRFNPINLKRKHVDEILIALAGPLSNLVIAIIILVLVRILYFFLYFNENEVGLYILNTLVLWSAINISIFVFNLIPIPPLDGSHIYTTYIKSINISLLNLVYKIGTYSLLAIIILENYSEIEILPIGKITNAFIKICIEILQFN